MRDFRLWCRLNTWHTKLLRAWVGSHSMNTWHHHNRCDVIQFSVSSRPPLHLHLPSRLPSSLPPSLPLSLPFFPSCQVANVYRELHDKSNSTFCSFLILENFWNNHVYSYQCLDWSFRRLSKHMRIIISQKSLQIMPSVVERNLSATIKNTISEVKQEKK